MKTSNEKRKGIVYSSRCVVTDKRYVGQMGERHGKFAATLNTPEKMLAHRRYEHEAAARYHSSKDEGCKAFHPALQKYGAENFQWEILACANSQSELDELEDYYIRHFNTKAPPLGNGYNLKDGGGGGAHHAESRAKMSEKKRGQNRGKNNPMFGKKHSMKTRAKISEKKRGTKPSAETRAKQSEAQKVAQSRPGVKDKKAAAMRGKSNPNFGKTPSAETRAKQSAARCGKKMPPEAIAKRVAAMRGKKQSAEHIAKRVAAHLGKKRSAEARANMSAAQRRRRAAEGNSIISAPLI